MKKVPNAWTPIRGMDKPPLSDDQIREGIKSGAIPLGRDCRVSTKDVLPEFIDMESKEKKKKTKYNAKPTMYNGVRYHSKKEAKYAERLDLLQSVGEIEKWERQVKFSIDINEVHICNYFCDFKVYYNDRIEYVDIKGYRNPSSGAYQIFRLKKKCVKAIYNIDIIEK